MASPRKGSATLENIRVASATTPAPVSAADPAPVVEQFDWDSLSSPEVAVYTRNAPSKNAEATTPDAIKLRVVAGFEATAKAGGKIVWFVQECGTPERGQEFLKLARRYATFKDMTLRGKQNPNHESEVRYAVKVRETRKAK